MDFDLGCSSTKRFCSRSMRDFSRVRSRVMGSEIEGDWKPVSLAESNSSREEQKDNHREHRGTQRKSEEFPCVFPVYLCVPCGQEFLQYVPRQILILHDLTEHLLHVGRVHLELLALLFGRLEADLVEHALHDGVQAPGADIFSAFIYAKSKARDFFERFGRELQLYTFGFQQPDVLPRQRRFPLAPDAHQAFPGE